jgi:hypothetical protein
MGFFIVLIGDEPAMDAQARYYQRILARDPDEAEDVIEEYLKTNPPETVYDEVLLPALYYTKQDRERENVTDADAQFALQTTREILDDLSHDRAAAETMSTDTDPQRATDDPVVRVLMCPARDEVDAVALAMVSQLVERDRCQVEILGAAMLTSEVVDQVEQIRPDVCCIGTVAPGGLTHTRHLCKRLRARYPDLKLVVGRWGLHEEREEDAPQLVAAGADRVAMTLLEARDRIVELSPLTRRPGSAEPDRAEEAVAGYGYTPSERVALNRPDGGLSSGSPVRRGRDGFLPADRRND